jgi:hypothetical protein
MGLWARQEVALGKTKSNEGLVKVKGQEFGAVIGNSRILTRRVSNLGVGCTFPSTALRWHSHCWRKWLALGNLVCWWSLHNHRCSAHESRTSCFSPIGDRQIFIIVLVTVIALPAFQCVRCVCGGVLLIQEEPVVWWTMVYKGDPVAKHLQAVTLHCLLIISFDNLGSQLRDWEVPGTGFLNLSTLTFEAW